jgi:spindle pole body formation-associated protein
VKDAADATRLRHGLTTVDDARDAKSPTKPSGILLTPGTATARRKRVSFGHDVRDNVSTKTTSKSGLPDECPGKFPSPWAGNTGDGLRPRTRLTETMEKARSRVSRSKSGSKESDDEGAWEEVEDLDADPDITVDLNEPHSRSGKYWKSEFQRYHEEAKVEMDKLVKYKQLAKSYAKMKDTEAMDLNAKLKEEQERWPTWNE